MNPEDSAPEPPDSIITSPAVDVESPATGYQGPVKVTLLQGMKVLFDEKVGLIPVQVIDKAPKAGGNGYTNGH